ncbi:MAG: topoisomerase C-terminal repeat-containing protein, partial [Bacteroidales bacterium]|nr:topoisomerase C-terminal repeat-containing protein [Bacteroidales bacterium]
MDQIAATERFSQAPARYSEASLVRKMEELGIGRPSTYAPTISTIQQREYVEKGEREGEKRSFVQITLKEGKIKEANQTETTGSEKGKLVPTDIGMVVNDYLLDSFPKILNFNFTAKAEKDFDSIAEGEIQWQECIRTFYEEFHKSVSDAIEAKTEHKVGERILGTDPKSGRPVSVKIGRFGAVAQIGAGSDEEKPQFASIKKDQSIETITLEEALELFKLPRQVGSYEEKVVTVGVGRFGPYIRHNNVFVSIPKETDPMEITLEESIVLIELKRKKEKEKQIKVFAEEAELEICNGRFGPYIIYKGTNYKIPKGSKEPALLTFEDCKQIIEEAGTKPAKATKGSKGTKGSKETKTTKAKKATK